MECFLSFLVIFLSILHGDSLQAHELKSLYATARQVRALEGPEKAAVLYQEILRQNPSDRTAATWIAVGEYSTERHDRLGRGGDRGQRRELVKRLRSFDFQPGAIADLIFASDHVRANRAKASSAPLYLQPLRAGSPAPPIPESPLSACIQLLLLACCLPLDICNKLLGDDTVHLMEELGVAFASPQENMLIPYCHVMPLTVQGDTLYTATDLHPNVLSSTTVGSDDFAVMYIGPDSIGLVEHWCECQRPVPGDIIVDIGCGSGVQAMSLVYSSKGTVAKCVDINPRALRMTKLNFDWNGLEEPILIQGDVNTPFGQILHSDGESVLEKPATWEELLGRATTIVSNPPFLPVPVQDSLISKRHGYFSSGGSHGEQVLIGVVQLASKVLKKPDDSSLAVVSEFMNPQRNFGSRLSSWWGNGGPAKAVLFTNQFPVHAATYAERRADNADEIVVWKEHLRNEGIDFVSPGFMFLKCDRSDSVIGNGHDALQFVHFEVPRTQKGSIWSPGNMDAIKLTRQALVDMFS
jgi:hypothetical protein